MENWTEMEIKTPPKIHHINDLPNCLSNAEPRMYADDTHISFANNNIENINTVLNVGLARVEKWLTANKLTLNASKTHPCPIHPHCNDPLKANSVRSIRTDRQVLLPSVE